MAEVLNPVAIEQAIREAVATVTEGVEQVTIRLSAFREAERKFDLKWAKTYMSSTGPVEQRKQTCIIETEEEKLALDLAEVAYKYADRRTRAAESTLSAYQTLSKSVTAMYQTAGRGEF